MEESTSLSQIVSLSAEEIEWVYELDSIASGAGHQSLIVEFYDDSPRDDIEQIIFDSQEYGGGVLELEASGVGVPSRERASSDSVYRVLEQVEGPKVVPGVVTVGLLSKDRTPILPS